MQSYKKWATAGAALSIVGILAGCGQSSSVSGRVSSNLPLWMLISANDISSISVQGWGPGADGSFIVNPPAKQTATLINSLVNRLPKDKVIKLRVTAISQGGADWLVVKLKNGSSIEFANFPNDPTPIQYNVTLTSKSGKQEQSAMISDDSSVVTSTIQEISNKGVIVREKKH